jgi:hypothetical protein
MGSNATTRAARIKQGLCSICLKRKCTPGLSSRGKPYTTCRTCRKKLAEYDQRRTQQRLQSEEQHLKSEKQPKRQRPEPKAEKYQAVAIRRRTSAALVVTESTGAAKPAVAHAKPAAPAKRTDTPAKPAAVAAKPATAAAKPVAETVLATAPAALATASAAAAAQPAAAPAPVTAPASSAATAVTPAAATASGAVRVRPAAPTGPMPASVKPAAVSVAPVRLHTGALRDPLKIAEEVMAQARRHNSSMPTDEELDRLARAYVDSTKQPLDPRRLYVSFSAARQFGDLRRIRDPERARRQLTELLLYAHPTSSSPGVWRVRRHGLDVTARVARDEEGGTDLLVVVTASVRDD